MGLAERDYLRRGRGSGSRFAAIAEWSATTWLMVVLGGGFLLDAMLTPPLQQLPFVVTSQLPGETRSVGGNIFESSGGGEMVTMTMGPLVRHTHFSAAMTVDRGQWWRAATFPLVEPDVWPLFLNLLCLYGFARAMEEDWGARRVLLLFALCTLGGPAAYLALRGMGVAIIGSWAPLTGATAGVLGVLAAAACVGPDDEVNLWTSGVSLPRRTLALIACAAVALIAIKRDFTGAATAHVGGAVMGLLAVPLLRASRRYGRG